MNRILLVDDDPFALKALGRTLGYGNPDYHLTSFDDPLAALAFARRNPVDLVIADYVMPQMDGVRLVVELKRLVPGLIAILTSATSDPKAVIEGFDRAHIYRYLVKPWDESELLLTVADALNHREFVLARRLRQAG